MGFSLYLLRGVVSWFLIVSAASAYELIEPQVQPKIAIRCGPVHGVILKQVAPTYPAEARTKGIQGMVRISVLVGKDGVPSKLRVVSGPLELIGASLDAIKQWRYKPYKLNGEAVPVETSIDVNYVIPRKKSVARTTQH